MVILAMGLALGGDRALSLGGRVTAVASRDDRLCVALALKGSLERVIRCWHGEETTELRLGVDRTVASMALLPDGRLAYAGNIVHDSTWFVAIPDRPEAIFPRASFILLEATPEGVRQVDAQTDDRPAGEVVGGHRFVLSRTSRQPTGIWSLQRDGQTVWTYSDPSLKASLELHAVGGTPYVIGSYEDLGPGGLPPSEGSDGAILRLDATGAVRTPTRIPGPGTQRVTHLVSVGDRLAVVGYSTQGITLAGQPILADDCFVWWTSLEGG